MWWQCVVVVCAVVHLCACGRMLVVFPTPSRSHTLLGDHVVKTLLNAGHNVTYITTNTRVKASDRLKVIDVSSPNDDDIAGKDILGLPKMVNSRIPSHQFLAAGTRAAERILRHQHVQALLKDTRESYDVVIAEWYYSGLLAPLAAVFDCPLVWYSAVDASWMNLQLVHEPSSAAYTVDLMAPALATVPTSVGDRAYRICRQAYLSAWVYYMTHHVETPLYYEIYQLSIQLRGRTPPLYEDLVYNGSFLLLNSHPALGQGLPLPQNAKYVGGLHIQGKQAAAKLPKDLQTVLDNAKHGVIYFNLGGTISEDLPAELKQQLLRAFRQVEQTVIWRHQGALDYVPSNVALVERAPQQAILMHPNTIMMISHGGYLSYMEAMYYGIPIIGIPVEENQFLTVDLAVSRGRGIRVAYFGKMGYKIKEAIIEILGNYSYSSNAKEVSKILQQPLVPVHQELLYWIELVMSTEGAPHLRSLSVQLSVMERLHLDVITLVIMLAWFLTKVAKIVKVYWDDFGTDCHDLDDKKND